MRTAKLLIVLDLSDSPSIPGALLELLRSVDLVLLGVYPVPEQTVPDQARDQFEEASRRKLDALCRDVDAVGGQVEDRLVFTADVMDSVERVSREEGCDAVLTLRPMDGLERILVPIKSVRHYWVPEFLEELIEESGVELLLLHAVGRDEDPETLARMLQTVKRRLIEGGTGANRIRTSAETAGDRAEKILETAEDYDLLVMGETEGSLTEHLFGELHDRVAEEAPCPVIVVRRPNRHGADE